LCNQNKTILLDFAYSADKSKLMMQVIHSSIVPSHKQPVIHTVLYYNCP